LKRNNGNYWYGLFICLLWFGVVKLYRFDEYKYNYNEKKVVLSEKPEFKIKRYPKTTDYWVELNFIEDSEKYEISGVEYKFLNSKEFKLSIEIGDTVEIVEYDKRIFSIKKNNIDYLNYSKAENYKSEGEYFMTIYISIALILCLIPILINKKHELSFEIQKIKIKYNYVFIIYFIIIFITLYKIKK
jgi:hypothetical protein